MFVVKTMFNTDADGEPVSDDISDEERPTVYHGPFSTLDKAVIWMEDVYPDGDTDIWEQFAADLDIPTEWLNSPDALWTIGANTQ